MDKYGSDHLSTNTEISLTDRELDVLRLMDAGLSNQDIADQLTISYNTVTWYVKQIFNKLGVNRRTQAVAVARSMGILDGAKRSNARTGFRHNLPSQSTPFIGRASELAEIGSKLKGTDCRLLTLLGPGGSGKTRLAIEAAGTLFRDFKHGVFFVQLAPLQEADKIPSTIAKALNFSFSPQGTHKEQLLDYLRRKEMLLILDNFEHLLEGGAFVNEILRTAPETKILVTTRTSLMMMGEHIYPLWGMAYPETLDTLDDDFCQHSALELFEYGAKRRQPVFELTHENIPDVIRICRLVEGMPLGIILAANWVTMLSPSAIADEIERDLTFLETEMRDLPPRQRSMRSVFNHSWRLLTEKERQIVAALSVFRGGFTQEAARAVAGATKRDLMGLVDKTMLNCIANNRFEIHELLRQYTSEKLAVDPAVEAEIRDKHSDFFCHALSVWVRDIQGPRQAVAFQEIWIEINNIRAAWQWAVENTRLRSLMEATKGLSLFYYRSSHKLENDEILQSLVEKLDAVGASEISDAFDDDGKAPVNPLKLKARVLALQGGYNGFIGNLALCRELTQRSLSILEKPELREVDTRFEKAGSLWNLSSVTSLESVPEAKQLAEESFALFQAIGEDSYASRVLLFLAEMTSATITESRKYGERSLAIKRNLDDRVGIAEALVLLSQLAARQGQFKRAKVMIYEALEIYTELDDLHGIVGSYGALGTILVWQGKFTEARSLESEILATHHDLVFAQSHNALTFAQASFPNQYMGAYAAAREQAQHAIEVFRDVQHYFLIPYGTTMAVSILGRVALAENSLSEAENLLTKCISFYRSVRGAYLSQDLAALGYVMRGLNQIPKAHRNFLEALQLAIRDEDFLPLIHALPGIALLFADQGDVERAVELYALASTFGIVSNSKWFADIAGDEIEAMSAGLPIDVVETAKARGRNLDLWETADHLLVKLEERGWDSDIA